MPPRSASDCITPAFEHTKQQLFQPFRFAQWWRLAFVGLFAGEMSSGGCNGNFNVPSIPSNHDHGSQQTFLAAALPPELTAHPFLFAAIIAGLVVLFLAIAVVFMYVSSVLRFVLFDSVIARECHIREGWRRRKAIGLHFFWWQLALSAIASAVLIILMGIPALVTWRLGWFDAPREHIFGWVVGGLTLLLLVLVYLAVLGFVRVMTKDFVIPQMACEGIGAVEGWRRLLARMKAEKAGYAGYVGLKVLLDIAAVLLFAMITLIVLLLVLIPVIVLVFAAATNTHAAGLTWNPGTITLAVLAGVIAFAFIVSLVALIYVPAVVFFPTYAIYFFAPRYPPLADLLWPRPPAPPAPPLAELPSSPPLPPVLPPDPTPLPS
ncbi:MAG TPA: hypothetical protein VGD60_00415 [Candidatus Acidoferrales bacterium]